MISRVYEAEVNRAHIDGSITFRLDLGFDTYQNRNFRLHGVEIIDWEKFFRAVDRLSQSPEIYLQSHKLDGYYADITYFSDGKWYNFILDLIEANIVRRKNAGTAS